MTTRPSPEQARQSLDELDLRREQTAHESRSSRWWWVGGGAVLVLFGVISEVAPGFFSSWGGILGIAGGVIALVSTTRSWGALTGRRVHAQNPSGGTYLLSAVVMIVVLAVIGGVAIAAGASGLGHVGLLAGITAGLIMAIGGPRWEGYLAHRRSRA